MREGQNANQWTASTPAKGNWKTLLQQAKTFQEQTAAIRLAIKQGTPCCEIEEYIGDLFGPRGSAKGNLPD